MSRDSERPASDGPQHIEPADRPRPELLRGSRVALRPLCEADVAGLTWLLRKPGAAEWWPIHPQDVLMADVLGLDETSFALAVEYEENLIGVVMYTEELTRDYFSVGIDIALDVDLRGEGLGPEVLRTLIAWLIDVGGHHRITIDPAVANKPAIRAYEKVGFKPVGVMREYELGPDAVWRDGLLMDLLASEFDTKG